MADESTNNSLRDYGVAAPHGPNMDGKHHATDDIHKMNLNEQAVFDTILKPDDLYNENGVYWADLPIGQRWKFVRSVDSKETSRELAMIGAMMKKDPLSPIGAYFRNMVIPGAGLGLEGYVSLNRYMKSMLILQLRVVLHRKRQATLPSCLR
jgi:hypothetical protein